MAEWLSREALSFLPYTELINKGAQVIGVSDHLASDLPSLMRYAQSGKLSFRESALRFVDLDAAQKLSRAPRAESNGSTPPWMRSKAQPTTSAGPSRSDTLTSGRQSRPSSARERNLIVPCAEPTKAPGREVGAARFGRVLRNQHVLSHALTS